MALGVDLGEAGIPECDHTIQGETKEEVLSKAGEHLQTEHNMTMDDSLTDVVSALIGPMGK